MSQQLRLRPNRRFRHQVIQLPLRVALRLRSPVHSLPISPTLYRPVDRVPHRPVNLLVAQPAALVVDQVLLLWWRLLSNRPLNRRCSQAISRSVGQRLFLRASLQAHRHHSPGSTRPCRQAHSRPVDPHRSQLYTHRSRPRPHRHRWPQKAQHAPAVKFILAALRFVLFALFGFSYAHW